MKTMTTPGFTAAASLAGRGSYRGAKNDGERNGPSAVIPQLSCWRECRGISSNNHELAGCYKVCTQIKSIFLLD